MAWAHARVLQGTRTVRSVLAAARDLDARAVGKELERLASTLVRGAAERSSGPTTVADVAAQWRELAHLERALQVVGSDGDTAMAVYVQEPYDAQ